MTTYGPTDHPTALLYMRDCGAETKEFTCDDCGREGRPSDAHTLFHQDQDVIAWTNGEVRAECDTTKPKDERWTITEA